ncbi:nucleotide diphosphatase [Kluyveromyces lactis]|uniref:KLLA0F23628p n=1 Tax=Kluyveromyces lactis (strain ATCC 8585 / CBS 2359 / DSM 70799 / NBRC 1267 / NRRL Y-1140 / WM37) TaxID=284590 RepID=Q6CIV6_KLULA|nr:uncharacterized protein KLLA0_F23628g [Kluyveromyces lactis]CAG98841.1 KLLA0F23628p [Kluyveromyces lactis]|eukprot:XP_456133.1 uncharacterized protein KLLA0_F23628g [Kluyveromyces lactis]
MNPLSQKLTDKYEIILASSSPRRFEILTEQMGFDNIKVMKPSFEEDLDKSLYVKRPSDYVQDTCKEKAKSILQELTPGSKSKLVLCADTIVVDHTDEIYEKPVEKEIQLRNLLRFTQSGKPMRVITAVTIIIYNTPQEYSFDSFYEQTEVYFDSNIPRSIVEMYVESGDGLQVAGGFKVQGFSGCLIKKVNGDYYNVVGLPLNGTWKRLCTLI